MTALDWAEHAARLFEQPAGPRWATPGELAKAINPNTVQTPALDLVDEAVVETMNTPDGRLIITMGPQEGKSTRVAQDTPTWKLADDPDARVVVASYGQALAVRNGRAIRRRIEGFTHLHGLTIAADNGAVHDWTLNGHQGGVLSVGIGSGLTGRPADCVSADTRILSDRGEITAADAFKLGITRVLAYDHATGRAVWRDVEAARRIAGRRVVDVVTKSGRVLTCTPDHRVYTGRGYVPAGSLRPGDALVAFVGARGVPMRKPSGHAEDGRPEDGSTGAGSLLLARVHGDGVLGGEQDAVLRVRGTAVPESPVDLLGRVRSIAAAAPDTGLPTVRHGVPTSLVADDVLLEGLRGRRTLGADGRPGELALQDRNELRALVPVDASADLGARRAQVRGLLGQPDVDLHARREAGQPVGAGDPSHRRGRGEQLAAESDHAVLDVPRRAPQVEADAVAVVRDRGDETVDVYDFQVAGTRNFFGDGVLVHNCLVIDDPIKDRKEADSAVYRQSVWDWWTDVASTRLAPGAPVIIILTRWHEDDLAGRLLAAEDGHLWRVVNIPAQADHDPAKGEQDPLGREPGEYMISARKRTRRQWEAIKVRSGARTWASLYQGRPAPAEGSLFKRDAWARYDTPMALERPDGSMWVPVSDGDEIAMSWDMAFKGTDSADYVVGQVWLRRGVHLYLLDMVRRRMTFTETLAAVKALSARWPQAFAKLVEDKANGTAVIDLLSRTVPGLIPVEPDGGKEARANAASPFVEARNVHLPTAELLPNVEELVEEAAAFPNGRHDDAVDALTQAINRMLINPLLFGGHDDEPDWDEIDDEMAISRY